jgi:exonuclease III
MSDIRLNSQTQTHAIDDITKKINFAGYEFLFNSPTASRGVGILIKKTLKYSVPVKLGDATGNILVINLHVDGVPVTVGSVYGPNENDLGFFGTVERYVR